MLVQAAHLGFQLMHKLINSDKMRGDQTLYVILYQEQLLGWKNDIAPFD
jgi:hypothetical protein